MERAHARVFRLLELGDNFVKYARPGSEGRAAERARKRYNKARSLAERAGDAELIEQVELRLDDLERRRGANDERQESENPRLEVSDQVISELPEHAAERVPPGQRVTRGWPVLHEGRIPRFDPQAWRLEIDGLCATPVRLAYDQLKALPIAHVRSDMHCVTGWSKLDNEWTGVQTKTLFELARPQPQARFVLVEAEQGYTANVPLELLLADDALVAWAHQGRDLEPKHGFPLRLVVPRLYAWKSVKWVRRFELLADDRRGFWEVRGYHNHADPWREERYSYQET